ncbi:oligoendopeptidase F [Erysipelothrix rhusiopathiae]|nr:oligoendopeptidase F [Erysipelothrix rhusiopathiae]
MAKKLVHRSDVNPEHTWDLSGLFKTEEDYNQTFDELEKEVDTFVSTYKGQLSTPEKIVEALGVYAPMYVKMVHLGTYNSLSASADQSNEETIQRYGLYAIRTTEISNKLTFFTSEISGNDYKTLEDAAQLDEFSKGFLKQILREKPHALSPEVEAAVTALNAALDAPYSIYNRGKLQDMSFDDFEVNGKTYPNSFVLFEGEWEYEIDHDVRHKAFEEFYGKLAEYQHTFAEVYQTQVLKEKALATLKGFDSVIDYLLFDQEVSRDMYDRQIDLITEHLAPHMRKYAQLLQSVHGLESMSFFDLLMPLDPGFEPDISIEASREKLLEGLSILGDDYLAMVNRAFDERWIDFPQNIGKSTGAFCSSPYGAHPFVLISWTERMREVFVLAHELGHAGHFYLAGQNQNIYDTRPSLYFIEAPSTMNELIMANHLTTQSEDPRFKRWVLSTMISRTYYHNFVTHLLEAAYQREVYRAVDAGKPLSTSGLNAMKRSVLEAFWGDVVTINPNVELTWMRQPHYYMGLYPYTYSAGLTIATEVSQKVLNGTLDIERWKDVLKAGGTKTPLELAQMVDVDLSTDAPLRHTIKHIGSMIDEIIDLTEQMK